jgi:hypothetical protein
MYNPCNKLSKSEKEYDRKMAIERDGAKERYERSLEIAENLVKQDSKNLEYQRDVSVSLNNLAQIQLCQRDVEGAKVRYERSLKISEKLVKQGSKNFQYQKGLEYVKNKLQELQKSYYTLANRLRNIFRFKK